MFREHSNLLDGFQHGPAPVPWLGGLSDAVEACHTMPLSVLQLPVKGVGQHQHTVIQVEVGHLREGERVEKVQVCLVCNVSSSNTCGQQRCDKWAHRCSRLEHKVHLLQLKAATYHINELSHDIQNLFVLVLQPFHVL